MKIFVKMTLLYMILVVSVLASEIEKPPGSKTIKVQKGETLSAIAKAHLSNPSRWRELLKYNNIPNPNLIRPGMDLIIPAFLGKEPIAITNFVYGKVDWKAGEGTQEWKGLVKDHQLYPLDTVRTLQKSKADLTIQGSGLVRIHENSILQINYVKSEISTPSIYLRKGSLDSFISRMFIQGKPREGEKLQIKTPSALAAVRGTEFRVEVDNSENSTVSCFDGLVAVSAEEKTVDLPKGFATFVKKGEPPSDPYPIPDPPKLEK